MRGPCPVTIEPIRPRARLIQWWRVERFCTGIHCARRRVSGPPFRTRTRNQCRSVRGHRCVLRGGSLLVDAAQGPPESRVVCIQAAARDRGDLHRSGTAASCPIGTARDRWDGRTRARGCGESGRGNAKSGRGTEERNQEARDAHHATARTMEPLLGQRRRPLTRISPLVLRIRRSSSRSSASALAPADAAAAPMRSSPVAGIAACREGHRPTADRR
jgi:hypothetical protein